MLVRARKSGKKWTKKSVNLARAEVVEGFRPALQTSDKCLKSLDPVKMRRMRRLLQLSCPPPSRAAPLLIVSRPR